MHVPSPVDDEGEHRPPCACLVQPSSAGRRRQKHGTYTYVCAGMYVAVLYVEDDVDSSRYDRILIFDAAFSIDIDMI